MAFTTLKSAANHHLVTVGLGIKSLSCVGYWRLQAVISEVVPALCSAVTRNIEKRVLKRRGMEVIKSLV